MLLLLLLLLSLLTGIQLLISRCVDFHISYFTFYESYDGFKDKKPDDADELCFSLSYSVVLLSTLAIDVDCNEWTTHFTKGSVMRCKDMVS